MDRFGLSARWRRIVTVLFGVCTWAAAEEKPPAPQQPARAEPQDAIRPEAKRAGLGQLHRDFGFPGAVRVWERGMYLNPRHAPYDTSYPARYRPYYGDYAGGYGYDSPYRARYGDNRLYRESYDGSAYQSYALRLDHAYDLGVAPPEIQDRLAAQAERSLTTYTDVMNAGHDAFLRGRYSEAARYFLLASQLNQGDPSSRLCAAHAQTALGQYPSAAGLVRRAFDLQPKLAYLSLDIRDSYGQPGDFAQHLAALGEAAQGSDSSDLWFLLGYYHHNSGAPDRAATALARARQLDPGDRIIGRFAEVLAGAAP